MGRHRKDGVVVPIDEGDIEVFHPVCRSRIVILTIRLCRVGSGNGELQLYVTGICKRCDRYVYLSLKHSSLISGDE